MGIIMWLIFGALAGWIASLIMHTDAQQGAIGNIVVGIAGALIGGFIAQRLGGSPINKFNLTNLLVAIAGSVLLLFVVRLLTNSRHPSA